MKGFDFFGHNQWNLLGSRGGALTTVNVPTIINTWIVLAVLIALIFLGRHLIQHPKTISGHLLKKFIKSFMDLTEQSMGTFKLEYFGYITSLFIFIISCNWIAILPGIEEPTNDLNTALALAVTTFLYIQAESIRAHGIVAYIKHFFLPFAPMFFLNIIEILSSILSLSFRLFGNILGGSIISGLYYQSVSGSIVLHLVTSIIGIPLIINAFFVIFEGFLQAFVFSILSLTNLAMAVQEGEE